VISQANDASFLRGRESPWRQVVRDG
jgi:hypothetical protein